MPGRPAVPEGDLARYDVGVPEAAHPVMHTGQFDPLPNGLYVIDADGTGSWVP